MKKLLSIAILFISLAALAQTKPLIFSTDAGAINGYDPVNYFTDNIAILGSPEITYSWNDAVWHFVSEQNLERFKADPEKYAPQFGGYCAFTLASGRKETSDPSLFNIIDGKLYLHYNPFVQKTWLKNPKGLIDQGNKRWPTVSKQ